MYNKEYKERFMAERENREYLECQFKKVSFMEFELNKDVSNFTFYEIIEYYKLLNTCSLEYLRVLNSQFSLYTQWCLQQNLVNDSQNHYLEVRTEDYDNCVNKTLVNLKVIPKKLVLDWVDSLQNPRDKFILLGLFEGIKGQDFCELGKLKPEDVHGNTLNLCTGRKVVISNKLKDIIENCTTETMYYGMKSRDSYRKFPLIDRGFIIKDYPNSKDDVSDFQRGRQIYNSIQRIMQYIGIYPNVSANELFESGKIDMIQTCAKELKMSCADYIYSEKISEVEEKYNCTILKKTYIMKYKDYLD